MGTLMVGERKETQDAGSPSSERNLTYLANGRVPFDAPTQHRPRAVGLDSPENRRKVSPATSVAPLGSSPLGRTYPALDTSYHV